MPEPINPEINTNPEQPETRPEAAPDRKEAEMIQGAELLETPPDGSFILGLQTFVAWVHDLLAKDDKN